MRLEDFLQPNPSLNQNYNFGIAPLYDSFQTNQSLNFDQPLELEGLNQNQQVQVSPREVLGNVAKEAAINYVGKKVGLPALGRVIATNTILGNPFATAVTPFAPLAAVSAIGKGLSGLQNTTFGRSATFADYLEAKRAEKAINKVELKELQQRIDKGEFGGSDGGKSGGLNSGGREGYGAGGQYK